MKYNEDLMIEIKMFVDKLITTEYGKHFKLKDFKSEEDRVLHIIRFYKDKSPVNVCWSCRRSRYEVMVDLLCNIIMNPHDDITLSNFINDKTARNGIDNYKKILSSATYDDIIDQAFIGSNTYVFICPVCRGVTTYGVLCKLEDLHEKVSKSKSDILDNLISDDYYEYRTRDK